MGCPLGGAARGRASASYADVTDVTGVTRATAWRSCCAAAGTYASPMSNRSGAGACAAGRRRRQRGVRVTVAGCLLAAATLVVVGAVVLGSLVAITSAAVLALLAGFASTRIVANELAQSRREAARERAALAHDYTRLAAERIDEHAGFAGAMTERILERDAEIGRLRGTIRLADRRTDQALERLRSEQECTAELQARVEQLGRELEERDDSLAFWDGGDAPTVVDLLAWEERNNVAERTDLRRQA